MNGTMTRRVFLGRAGGLTLTLGTAGMWRPANRLAAINPYRNGRWLAGDHHIHTKYSPDGQLEIGAQVANAVKYGLDWCVITDHGGPSHDKVALDLAYPDLIAARAKYPSIQVFQGMEWNIPAAEHGSVILPPTPDEARKVAEFEARFDEKNLAPKPIPANTEQAAVEAIRYLESLTPKPLFFANHPARRGLDSPHEMRAWALAGSGVTRGFEGAPGHQGTPFAGKRRGEYDKSSAKESFQGYPAESYRTWGGYDWYTAKVGGLWDSLLGEGLPWFITSNGDSHRHWDNRNEIDTSTYLTKGFVTDTGRVTDHGTDFDFYPGEYAKNWVFAADSGPFSILDGLRTGSMFTVLGGLIDRLELFAASSDDSARMGGTLTLERAGQDVTITIRVRVPKGPNFGGRALSLHHIDLIAGEIIGMAMDRDTMTNPTSRVVHQFPAGEGSRDGEYLQFDWRFPKVRRSFYVRVRGTNTAVDSPRVDPIDVDPWSDLWFYSNPVFIRIPGD